MIRYRNPSTGKFKYEKLPDLPEPDLKRWLVRKALKIQTERLDAPPPAPVVVAPVGLPVARAVTEYLGAARLRQATIDSYTTSSVKLLAWPDLPAFMEAFDMATLRALRMWLCQQDLKAVSINTHLRQLGTFFNYWRKNGKCPLLTLDALADGLEALPDDSDKKTPLSFAEIRQLVMAVNQFVAESGAEESDNFRSLVLCLLLTGMRAGEGLKLRPEHLLDGAILLTEDIVKTKQRRVVDLSVCPSLKLTARGPLVFGFDKRSFEKMRYSLKGAPRGWTPQRLRVTCGTYLTCAPGIYGGASAYMSAKRLGHSVAVAERHYVGMVKVDPAAKTIEEAMGIADLLTTRQ